MTKRALLAVAGFLSLCLSMSAQQTQRPGQLLFDDSLLGPEFSRQPALMLENRDRFFFSTAFGSMRATEDFLPAFDPVEPLSYALPATTSRRNSLDNGVELRAPERISFGGEVGFLYGKSTGKYGREDFQTYILGTVGNDKFSITVGALHQESTLSVPRWHR